MLKDSGWFGEWFVKFQRIIASTMLGEVLKTSVLLKQYPRTVETREARRFEFGWSKLSHLI